jgi:DNA-binding PadR family transcriptional regulator
MKPHTVRRSTLALAILALLYEAPMHPYRMQQLIKERGKDRVINVQQRASIYQTIERLLRAGLIAVAETTRDERWPERTLYQLTEAGKETAIAWLREMLATPAREFPEFPAAISLVFGLTPEEVVELLDRRSAALATALAKTEAGLEDVGKVVPRLFLLEEEYLCAVLRAELGWVRGIADDLRSGRLTWTEAWIREIAERLTTPEEPLEGGGMIPER